MRKLLVLGAGGFIAGRFIEMFGDRYVIVPVVSDADGRNPDLSIHEECYPLLEEHRPDAVLNLAGKSYHSSEDDGGIYESNALVQLNIHQAVHRLGLRTRTLFCSSSAVYESSTGPVDETDSILPVNSYAKSKLMQERVALSYHPAQEVVIARLFNVIGPFQNENFFIPTLIRRVLEFRDGKAAAVRLKTLNAMRDFVDVDDVCAAIDLLMEKGESGEVYNVCRGEGVPVEKVIEIIKGMLDISDLPIDARDDHVREGINYQVGSNGKISRLGWTPEYGIERSLERILREEHGC